MMAKILTLVIGAIGDMRAPRRRRPMKAKTQLKDQSK